MAKTAKLGAGELTELLTILSPSPVSRAITSITRVGALATVVTAAPHGFNDGDYVTLSGVTPADYNGEVPIDATSPTMFTFAVTGTPATPASVPGAVVFTSDAQGGQGPAWHTLATVRGRMRPLSASELLAAKAINSTQTYEGTIYYRVPQDVTPKMQVQWTPYGYAAPKQLEIHGALPDKDEPRRLLTLDVGEVVAA
jgi:SPP1 family predicted phage head-tail adaptor